MAMAKVKAKVPENSVFSDDGDLLKSKYRRRRRGVGYEGFRVFFVYTQKSLI